MELMSNRDDCFKLAQILKNGVGKRIEFYGSTYLEVLSGKCVSSYNYDENSFFNRKCVSFYCKYCENGFLRIGVGKDVFYESSIGERLAVLSDFYQVLRNEFGEPTLFYTTKNDEEEYLTLQYSFINKEEEIINFKNGTYFDDAEIDKLIILGEDKDNTFEEYKLSDKMKFFISDKLGLPYEMIGLVEDNFEEYMKHKIGMEGYFSKQENTSVVKRLRK